MIGFDFCLKEVVCVACRAPREEMSNIDITADGRIHSRFGQRFSELLNTNCYGILN